MAEANRGRGRGIAMGRGAQLLAAIAASKQRPGSADSESDQQAANVGTCTPPLPSTASVSPNPVEAVSSQEDANPAVRVPVLRAPMGRAAAFQHLLAQRSSPMPSPTPSSGPSPAPATSPSLGPSPVSDQTISRPPSVDRPASGSGRGMMAAMLKMSTMKLADKPTSSIRIAESEARQPKLFESVESKIVPILTHSEPPPVIRKGEIGQPVDIVANYVRVTIEQNKGIYEYEVRCEPSIDSRDLIFKVVGQHREILGPAKTFDGVTLYLPFQFPNNLTILNSKHPVTHEDVKVKIILRQKRRAADCLHFYNVLFRKIARILGMVQINRNYFNPHSPIQMTAEKLEVWPGYVTAVNEYEDGLMLNCDVSFRVLRTTTVLEELVEISRGPGIFKQTAQDVLVGLCVLTRYNNKFYRIDDILFDKNPQSTFECQGTEMTFLEYYKTHYGIEIKDKAQPLLLNRLKKKVQGQEDETVLVCLVPELCFLTGLDDRLRKNMTTMRALANHTRVPPNERDAALRRYLDSVNTNPKAASILSEWGLRLDHAALQVKGRVMEPEKIHLGRAIFPTNPQCDWSKNLMNDIINPVRILNWILVTTDRDKAKGCEFADTLMDVGRKMGMEIKPPRMISLPNDRTDTYVNRIRESINPQLELAVVVFPTMRDDRYSAVKTLCTAQAAIPSQMINCRTISNSTRLRSVVQKIALQINCKMGGELWAVHIPTKTMMVCGVDVYHDPTRRGQSVVGFLASVNPALTRWYSRSKYQAAGQELVDTLKSCLIECLIKYFELNKDYPKQIVLYRDGVGDGQLQSMLDHESVQLLTAFKMVDPNYEPKFTMVIVQKKINTRFFMKTGNNLANPPPGTIVDHTFTRRNWWDFFLVSQHVNQGTVSPTHYIVVYDGGLKPDNLQKLTYKMAHMYYNWPGTIRVPAPCQYAHKLAYLVGQNIRKDVSDKLCDRLFFL